MMRKNLKKLGMNALLVLAKEVLEVLILVTMEWNGGKKIQNL